MPKISPLSEVSSAARIADDVEIGPFCMIGPDVTLGAGCTLMNNVTMLGRVTVGAGNVFFPYSIVGTAPQDLKYRGGPTRIEIGDRNQFREYVTVHPGTEAGGALTRVGSDSLFMVGSHIAHDCLLDDKVMLGNYSQLAGHVRMETCSVMSALSGVHHFVTIGKYAFVGGLTAVKRDVPPFTIFFGQPGEIRGVNKTGMCRNGLSDAQIERVEAAYRRLFLGKNDQLRAIEEIQRENGLDENVRYLCEFLKATTEGKFGRYRESLRDHGDKTVWKPGALGQTN